jgi:hypothetical protein
LNFEAPNNQMPAGNIALAKYGAGLWNFSISNIAGLVRGWTVFVSTSLQVSTLRF